MKKLLFIAILVFGAHESLSQDVHLSSKKSETSLGIGLGLPYGGLGLRVGTNVADHLNLFGGIGYQFAGLGYNFGIRKDFPSNGQAQFYLTGMYGSNAVIVVEGLSEYDNLYYGPSLGLGVKINSRKTEGNYWDLGLLLPIESSSFKDDSNLVKNDPRVSDFKDASPVLIVVGYNFKL